MELENGFLYRKKSAPLICHAVSGMYHRILSAASDAGGGLFSEL